MEHEDHSLAEDLERMLATRTKRRQSLRWLLASAAAVPLAGCGSRASGSTRIAVPASATGARCALIPQETQGPFPADGSNDNGHGVANALTLSGIVRGVQAADSKGMLSFTTIFPGCYAGRMPHIHLEVYPSLAKASSAANGIKTSQFTFPMATLNEAYATAAYGESARKLSGMSYATDNVFSDGTALQMASVSGDPVKGYVITLTVGVSL